MMEELVSVVSLVSSDSGSKYFVIAECFMEV